MYQTPEYKSAALASHSCTFKALLSFFFLFFISFQLMAQDSLKVFYDDHPEIFKNASHQKYIPQLTQKQINNRIKIIAATNISGYSGAMIGLYHAWYKNYPQSNFHTFNDNKESMMKITIISVERKNINNN